jgi:hypothetical protein
MRSEDLILLFSVVIPLFLITIFLLIFIIKNIKEMKAIEKKNKILEANKQSELIEKLNYTKMYFNDFIRRNQ